jgi:TatD DNase family protein
MILFDIGANLTHESFNQDLTEVLLRAREAGIERLIVTGASLEGTVAARALAEQDDNLWSTAGVHPHHAETLTEGCLSQLAELAQQPKIVAIGETGLDYFRDFTPRAVQRDAFEAQLQLAADVGKPVFLHERDAAEDFITLLSQYRDQLSNVVVHCFTGDASALEAYLDLDCHIGITGWICDERRGKHLHELVSRIPTGKLMIETDAPYLLPRTLKPKPKNRRCEPCHLLEVARVIAPLRGQTMQALAEETTATANRFFRL